MRFDLGDMRDLYARYDGGWWGVWPGPCERDYARAVAGGNLSAARSFEEWQGRPPFIVDGATPPCSMSGGAHFSSTRVRGRVAEGYRFPWDGRTVTVTSFASDGESLTACSYHPSTDGEYRRRIHRRYGITRADIIADRKARKAAAAAEENRDRAAEAAAADAT